MPLPIVLGRIVPMLCVVAVTVAAVGATLVTRVAPPHEQRPTSAGFREIVVAPRVDAAVLQRPAVCRDCAQPASQARTL